MDSNVPRRSFLTTSGLLLGSVAATPAAALERLLNPGRGPAQAQRGTWIPSEALLQRLPDLMREASVPAVSIGVVEGGEVTFARALGVRNSTTGEPANEHTVFEAASLSKPPVAYVAMLLREEGLLDIDRPLVEYVEPAQLLDDPRARRLTARHLMSQSSGLRNWRRPKDTEFPLSFEPGSQYQYSGEGFVWLLRVLEQITGTGFVRLMRERLFDPLGLDATTFLWNPSFADRMATGHNRQGEPTRGGMHLTMARAHHEIAAKWSKPAENWMWDDLVSAAREEDPSREPAAGGLVPNAAASLLTTAAQYALFTAQVLDSPPPGPAALSPESRALMLTLHTTVQGPLAWGLGFALEDRGDSRYVWHWGNNGDFHSFVIGDVTAGRTLVVLTNAAGGPGVYKAIVRDAVGFDPASLDWI